MTRQEALDRLLTAKKDKGLSYADIGTALGRDKVWVAAAFMGQATLSAEEAGQLGELLYHIPLEVVHSSQGGRKIV
jgi:cyanate lyase